MGAETVQTDLVVIGSGGAGLTGALTAAIGGLRVTVLEKTELLGGTTAVSGGTVWVPNNHHEPEAGVADSPEDALTYVRACVGDAGDPTHIDAIALRSAEAIRFLEERGGLEFLPMPAGGGSMDYRPWLPGAKIGGRALTPAETTLEPLGDQARLLRIVPTSAWTFDPRDYISERMHLDAPGTDRPGASLFSPPPANDGTAALPVSLGRGSALIAQLIRGCLAHGVEYHVGTRAQQLLIDDARVIGVRTISDDGSVTMFHASVGVIVATGGYSHDEALRRLWLSRKIQRSCELDTNSGDGHLMGMAIGAQTAGMGDAWWMPHVPLGADNQAVNTAGSREDRSLPHTIMVNATGRRFMNESVNYHDVGEYFDSVVGGFHSNFPAWLVFDQQGVEKYAALDWKVPSGSEPTPDWLKSGRTVGELADSMGVSASALEATVARFNEFATSGTDEDFHRGESEWDRAWGDHRHTPNPSLGSLERGPFYAARIYAGTLSTRGGLRVDTDGRVHSAATGEPIAGLYAAGNCSNGGPASTYPGPGATLGAALTFGYLAGLHAATKKQ